MGKAGIIYHSEKVDKKRLSAAVEEALKGLGWQPTSYYPTSFEEPGGTQARQALRDGATVIVVAGGDGSVRHVVEALRGADVAVGIVPLGTGNVLARNLGIQLGNLPRLVKNALLGQDHLIDVGLARMDFGDDRGKVEHIYTVMAGIGLDAKIMMNTDHRLKRRIGWIAYIDGGLKSLPVVFERMEVSVNGRPRRAIKVHSLIIGNCGFLPGNITLMPDAKLDDGILDVAAVGPRRAWNWLDFWNRVTWVSWTRNRIKAWRKIVDITANVKTLENLNGQAIDVWPANPIDIQLDGDPFGKVVGVRVEVLPKALRVRL